MLPKPKFSNGGRILCFHGKLLYEAKILKTSAIINGKNEVKYLIHYAGWNKNWDEWVSENRILNLNEINLQTKKDLVASFTSAPSQKQNTSRELKRRRSECERQAGEPKKNKKRLNDRSIGADKTFLKKAELKIKIPEELKRWLDYDYDAINRQHKLLEIPAKKTVKDIIDSYIQMKKSTKSKDQRKEAVLIDVMYGLLKYFDVMLVPLLLYNSERSQYAEIVKENPNTQMANLYGSFHLLRLFVHLGSVFAYITLDDKDNNVLLENVHDFLNYLVENMNIYFSKQRDTTKEAL